MLGFISKLAPVRPATRSLVCGAALIGLSGLVSPLAAEPLIDRLRQAVSTHSLVLGPTQLVRSFEERQKEAKGAWYPQLDVTAFAGPDQQINEGSDNTRLLARELDLKVTQNLYDFGATHASIKQARLNAAAGRALGMANWLMAVPALEAAGRQPLPDGREATVARLAREGLAALAEVRAGCSAVPGTARAAQSPGKP